MAHRRPALPTSRRAVRTVALTALACVPAPLLLVGGTGPASAGVHPDDAQASVIHVRKTDRIGDLDSYGGRVGKAPRVRRAATDLRSTTFRVDRVARTITVTWKVRDLRRVRGGQLFGLLAGPDGAQPGEGPVAVLDLHAKDVYAFDESGFRDCRKATHRVQWRRDSVVATVPFACLRPGEAAWLQGATATVPPRRGIELLDQAPRTRILPFTAYQAPTAEEPAQDGTTGTTPSTSPRTGGSLDDMRRAARLMAR